MNYMCRLCLGNSGLIGVFDTLDSEDLIEKILTIANVHIQITDSLPKKICLKCYMLVLKVHKFRILCSTINQLLIDKYESKSNELLQAAQCENVEEWLDVESITSNCTSETISVCSTSNTFQNDVPPSNNLRPRPPPNIRLNNKSDLLKILKITDLKSNKPFENKGNKNKRQREHTLEETVPDSKKIKTDDLRKDVVCPLCKITLPSWKMYRKHFSKHRSCPPCDVHFKNIGQMTRHMKYICPNFGKMRVLLNRLDDDIDLCKKYDITNLNLTESNASNTPDEKSSVVLSSDINLTELYENPKSETLVQNNEEITFKLSLASKCDEDLTFRKNICEKKKTVVIDTSNIDDISINVESSKEKQVCQYNESDKEVKVETVYEVDIQNDASKLNQDVNEIDNLNDTSNNSNADISTISPEIVTKDILDYRQIKRINNITVLEDNNIIGKETTIFITSDQNVNEIIEKENLNTETEKELVENEDNNVNRNSPIQMEDETINADEQEQQSQIDKIVDDLNLKSIDSMPNSDRVIELNDDCISNLTPKIIEAPKPSIKLKLKTDETFILRNLLLRKSEISNSQPVNPSDIIVVDDETSEHDANEDNGNDVIVINDDEMEISSNNDQSNLITTVALINKEFMIYVPNTNKCENETLKMIFANHMNLCSKNKQDSSQLIVKNIFDKLEENILIDVTVGSEYTGKLIKLKESVEGTQQTNVSVKNKTNVVTYHKDILNFQRDKQSTILIPATVTLQSTDTTVSNVTSVMSPRIETSLSVAPHIAASTDCTVKNVTPVFTSTTNLRPTNCLRTYGKSVNTVAKIDPKIVKVAPIPLLSVEMLRELINKTISSRTLKQFDSRSSTESWESPITSMTSSTNRCMEITPKPLIPAISIPNSEHVVANTGQFIKLRVRNISEINNAEL